MKMNRNFLAVALWFAFASCAIPGLYADPTANPPPPSTLSNDLEKMDVVAFVKLVRIVRQYEMFPEAVGEFEITSIVKGNTFTVGQKLELKYHAAAKIGDSHLLKGSSSKQMQWKMQWSFPELLSARAMDYVQKLTTLPKNSAQRLPFFLVYLDDEDKMLARDAFESFAPSSYAEIQSLKPHLKHDPIVKNIQNSETPVGPRRLYLKFLGICGNEHDLPWLEADMRTTADRKGRAPLDAVIACYLTLKGETGVALVEDLFLRNAKSDYQSTYAAILALKFHGNEASVLKRERLLQAMRLVLKRPELADVVIPELVAWKDWKASEELFELFKAADERSSWVRVPVINYLRKCPTERAKEMLAECEKIDPAAAKRAKVFFQDTP